MRRKIIFIGPVGVGKSTLITNLRKSEKPVLKTQAITYEGEFIDIPGEYMEIRRFNYAVINEILSAEAVFIVQDATSNRMAVPPGFCKAFEGKKVFGIVNKIDLEGANLRRSEELLIESGVKKENIFFVSAKTGEGISTLEKVINELLNG
ncbi:MAG: Ethanolamine utilization protein-like protein [Caldanaerobacter subterraneus]|jgi:ethanolamine utilization protein EutP|uniref:Ethanolamine utilization protein n=1 Tax=Caldanaerobacter subterraneus TaxID=911092 RepID=A0A117KVB7_9THEO|nr:MULTISPECIES: EutP/PduV family microcompartment system protein [Caldanaerobacter]KUK07916.1 MAG: Ethanolamine utilization protein-like protein [Caldanaerobacter subterraneus]MDI3519823.1 ethanolamine utilization protein EutP [Caldanaerobacter sp.]HBT49780.1 ethanolamine utilization protein [Caldanaerobacter subterraneus]